MREKENMNEHERDQQGKETPAPRSRWIQFVAFVAAGLATALIAVAAYDHFVRIPELERDYEEKVAAYERLQADFDRVASNTGGIVEAATPATPAATPSGSTLSDLIDD